MYIQHSNLVEQLERHNGVKCYDISSEGVPGISRCNVVLNPPQRPLICSSDMQLVSDP